MDDKNKIYRLVIDDTVYDTRLTAKFKNRRRYAKENPDQIKAFIPGIIREIKIKNGAKVKAGDELLILEAMKMKNVVTSHRDGKIKEIKINTGEMVTKNQLLIEFE